MKKQITTILSLLFFISFISALNITAGESYSFESEEYDYWDVVGNSSNMDGMNVSWEEGNITLDFDIRYKPDNFTLIFFNNETEVVKEIHHYSGGGSSIRYVDRNITQYINLPCKEDVCDIPEINETLEDVIKEEPKLNWFQRFWNWLKSLFNNGERR